MANPEELESFCFICNKQQTFEKVKILELDTLYNCKACRSVQNVPWLAGVNLEKYLKSLELY